MKSYPSSHWALKGEIDILQYEISVSSQSSFAKIATQVRLCKFVDPDESPQNINSGVDQSKSNISESLEDAIAG